MGWHEWRTVDKPDLDPDWGAVECDRCGYVLTMMRVNIGPWLDSPSYHGDCDQLIVKLIHEDRY